LRSAFFASLPWASLRFDSIWTAHNIECGHAQEPESIRRFGCERLIRA
jgi:hypothetical protein